MYKFTYFRRLPVIICQETRLCQTNQLGTFSDSKVNWLTMDADAVNWNNKRLN